ncbi:unnamed protein product, partial [Scytosiphon promiscuus]
MDNMLPVAVRIAYCFNFLKQGGADDDLFEKTLMGVQSTSALHREVLQVYQDKEMRNCFAYAAFAQEQGGSFPPWKAIPAGSKLSAPSVGNMESYCNKAFEE